MPNTIKAGDPVLVCVPDRGIKLMKVKVCAVTQIPGKTIGVELPNPDSNHDCDGFCKKNSGLWISPDQIVHAKNEDEAQRMMAEAAKLSEVDKPRQMVGSFEGGAFRLIEK